MSTGIIDQAMEYMAGTLEYSSTPVKVGKYNGSNVYRKVYTGNTPGSAGILFTDSVLTKFLHMEGYVKNIGDSRLCVPGYYVSASDNMVVYPQGSVMNFRAGDYGVLGNRPYWIAVYYTD